MKTITVNKFYNNLSRRNRNDIMDHFISNDITRKLTQSKYISVIDKEFLYVKPITTEQPIIREKIIKIDFPGRDTLSITRTNNSLNNIIQLKGVNTNDKNITKTSKYEGISDEDNVFYLTSLLPIEISGNNFQFNNWWLGIESNKSTPIGGGLEIPQRIQRTQIEKIKVIEGKVIQKKTIQEELVQVTEEQKKINREILGRKTELNKFVLSF